MYKTYDTLELATLVTKKGWADNMSFHPIVIITSDVNRVPLHMLEESEYRFALHYPTAIATLLTLNPKLDFMMDAGKRMNEYNYREIRAEVLQHYGKRITVDIGSETLIPELN